MDNNISQLHLEHKRLVEELMANLDFLAGSVSTKGLKCEAYNLTFKVDRVTKSKHIPKAKVEATRALVLKHKRVKALLKEIAAINWQLHLQDELVGAYTIL